MISSQYSYTKGYSALSFSTADLFAKNIPINMTILLLPNLAPSYRWEFFSHHDVRVTKFFDFRDGYLTFMADVAPVCCAPGNIQLSSSENWCHTVRIHLCKIFD